MSGEPLTQEQLRARLRAFKEQRGAEYHLQALGYFGSYARNEATAESDVDIVFETDEVDGFRILEMREELATLLGLPVDVVRLRPSLKPRLKARIEREAVYV